MRLSLHFQAPKPAFKTLVLTQVYDKTPVSESNYFVHMDSTIFPNPESYDPDRWIRAAQEGVRLDRYFVSFSKGSRMCVGIKYVVEFLLPFPSHSKHQSSVALFLSQPRLMLT